MNYWQKTKLKVIPSINRVRLNCRLEKTPKFFRIVIHEKAKPFFTWTKRVLTAISLLAAFYVFDHSIYAFLFGVGVWLLITFVEKTVFIYNSLFVMPPLTYEHDPARLLGTSFGVATPPDGGPEIPIVGFVVADEEYGRQMHETLKYWTDNNFHDEEGRVCLSAIVLNPKEYVFLCYPNLEHRAVEEFHKEVEGKRKEKSLTDIHIPTFALTIIGKRCQVGEGSYFPTFREKYREGVPVMFQICMPGEQGQVKDIDGLDHFVLFKLKIKDKEQLTRKEIEYDYLKVMG
ncbi:hypothetical protein OH460_16320 [Vibrio sp. Makdt]|uniref:hypothetical protein n=1 Tax=Vibrio sp. Makdt TaxID=2998828 RepID=UPI0022CD3E61|nr:hypothetical protein [Vibrio sp. Makdt]MDA0153886.1 hypothetical protein [Vibrio sp. Makdt]